MICRSVKVFMIRKLTLLFVPAIVAGISLVKAQSFDKVKADSLFDALSAEGKVKISVAISRNGQALYTRAIGQPTYNTETKYRVGSITKMFTASMIFQLIQEQKLSLDTKLSTYFPQIPNAGQITIAQMLSHGSGVHNFTGDADDFRNWQEKPQTHEQLLARIASRSEFEPGSKHEYSNSNFVLLGYIIEKLDGRPYAESLKKRITGKLGLKNTYYGGKIGTAANEAFSYKWVNDSWQLDTETDLSIPGGAGALVSTPTDLTKFMQALFGGKVVSDASLKQMHTITDGFGMNLFQFNFGKHIAYGHVGNIDSFRSQAAYFPEDGIAVAYAANGVNTNINNIMIALLTMLFGGK